MLKTEFEFYKILTSKMLFPYVSRFRNYTEKRQITGRKYSRHFTKQVRNKIYKRTKSERKTLFFRILLFIDWNIIVYDQTEESLVKPYTHFMCIGSTWMHTLHKLNWLLAPVVKLLNIFWTGTNMYLKIWNQVFKNVYFHLQGSLLSFDPSIMTVLSALVKDFNQMI
jgi:hypothetical protein